jgi:hypothetical protein
MTLTAHATERSTQMRLDLDEITATVRQPDLTYPSPPKYGPGRVISVGGRLAVVHSGATVITVLWRGRTCRA